MLSFFLCGCVGVAFSAISFSFHDSVTYVYNLLHGRVPLSPGLRHLGNRIKVKQKLGVIFSIEAVFFLFCF